MLRVPMIFGFALSHLVLVSSTFGQAPAAKTAPRPAPNYAPPGPAFAAPNCGAPAIPNCGAPPDICTCTTFKPLVDTTFRQQRVTTFQDICRTCFKQERYCEQVPVTKIDCVRVDEGCYKMVWVPKVVTKQVPRVEMHQQVRTRTVPYTVTQKVPQVTTHCVPEYRVRYVPETHTYTKPASQPCTTCAMPAPGCGSPFTMNGNQANGQAFASLPQNAYPANATPRGPVVPASAVSIPGQGNSVRPASGQYLRSHSAAAGSPFIGNVATR